MSTTKIKASDMYLFITQFPTLFKLFSMFSRLNIVLCEINITLKHYVILNNKHFLAPTRLCFSCNTFMEVKCDFFLSTNVHAVMAATCRSYGRISYTFPIWPNLEVKITRYIPNMNAVMTMSRSYTWKNLSAEVV